MHAVSHRNRRAFVHDRIDVDFHLEELSGWGAEVLRTRPSGGDEEEPKVGEDDRWQYSPRGRKLPRRGA